MAPEIGDSYSRLVPGKRVFWSGGGLAMIPLGGAEHSSEIKAVRFPHLNRAHGFLDFGAFSVAPIAAWI